MKYIVALDQGTTSSRAILFDEAQNIIGEEKFLLEYPIKLIPVKGHWRKVLHLGHPI